MKFFKKAIDMSEDIENTEQKRARTAVKKMTVSEKRLMSMKIIDLRNRGYSLHEIADMLSISHTTVKKYLDDATYELTQLAIEDANQSRELAISSLDRIKKETNAKIVKIKSDDSKSYINALKLLLNIDVEICKLRGLYVQTAVQTEIGNLIVDLSSAEDKEKQEKLMKDWINGNIQNEIAESEVRKQQELESKKS